MKMINANPPQAWVGREIADRYIVEELLWDGECSNIYQIRDKRYPNKLALKLYKNTGDPKQTQAHIELELELLGQCRSPHVVRFYEVVSPAPKRLGIVMDLVHGLNLERYVAQYGQPPLPQLLNIIRQLTNALIELHLQEIVHLQLLPKHLMIETLPSGEPFLHLVDFHAAQHTPAPPEAADAQAKTPQDDLYNVGDILYWLLTSRKHTPGQPAILPSSLGLPPELQHELEALLDLLLAIYPTRRLKDTFELLAMLDRIILLTRHIDPSDPAESELFTRSLAYELSEGLSETIDEENPASHTLEGNLLWPGLKPGLWNESFHQRALPYDATVSYQTKLAMLCFEQRLELRALDPAMATQMPEHWSAPLFFPETVTACAAFGDLFIVGTAQGKLWRLWLTHELRIDLWVNLSSSELELPIINICGDASNGHYLAQRADGHLFGFSPQSQQWRPLITLPLALHTSYHGKSGKLAMLTDQEQLSLVDLSTPKGPAETYRCAKAHHVCHSPDGYLLLIDTGQAISVRLTQRPTQVIATISRQPGEILSLGFSAKGDLMALIVHQDQLSWQTLWQPQQAA